MNPSDVLHYRRLLVEMIDNLGNQPAGTLPALLNTDDTDESILMDAIRDLGSFLIDADLYFVTGDMTAVTRTAAGSMPRQTLEVGDPPSREGFLVWDAPIGHAQFSDAEVGIRAAAWTTTEYADRPVWVRDDGEIWGPPNALYDAADPPDRWESGTELMVWFFVHGGSVDGPNVMIPVGMHYWNVGDLPADVHTYTTPDPTVGLLATWTLMDQSIAAPTPTKPLRAERRRTERAGLPINPLTVVRLRRLHHHHDTDPDHDTPNWTHRWLVSGHWRNQWIPSRAMHRLQWINAYVKGPEDAPLVVKDRVTALVR